MRIKKSFADTLGEMFKKNEKTEPEMAETMDAPKRNKVEGKKIRCPYCLKEFEINKVLFRVVADKLGGVDGFDPTTDHKLIDHWKKRGWDDQSAELREFSWGYAEVPAASLEGTVLTGIKSYLLDVSTIREIDCNEDGITIGATDIKGNYTDIRVCPDCHCILPKGYGTRKVYFIGIVGIQGSGKTVFLSKLFAKAGNNLLSDIGIGVNETDSMKRFIKSKPITPNSKLPEGTDPEKIAPPIFMTGAIGEDDNVEEIDFVFYDIAGENSHKTERLSTRGEHIKYADGVIMLIDPNTQIPEIKKIKGKEIIEKDRRGIAEVFSAMSNAFVGGRGRRIKRSKAKLAVVISMSDLLPSAVFENGKTIKADNILLKDINYNTGKEGFMAEQANEINAAILELIGNALPNLVKKYYKTSRYFAVSALGSEPKDGTAPSVDKCMRLEEPFAWILSELGVIESVGNKKWTYNGEIVGKVGEENEN